MIVTQVALKAEHLYFFWAWAGIIALSSSSCKKDELYEDFEAGDQHSYSDLDHMVTIADVISCGSLHLLHLSAWDAVKAVFHLGLRRSARKQSHQTVQIC